MLENSIASREHIHNAIKLGFNYPLGQLTLADLIGMDVVQFLADSIYEELKDP